MSLVMKYTRTHVKLLSLQLDESPISLLSVWTMPASSIRPKALSLMTTYAHHKAIYLLLAMSVRNISNADPLPFCLFHRHRHHHH